MSGRVADREDAGAPAAGDREVASESTAPEAAATPGRRSPAVRLLRGAMLLLSVACLVWVVRPVVAGASELADRVDGSRLAAAIGLGAVLYAALGTLLALGWWWLAGIYGERPGFRLGYAVFARSQLAKYLPGNAFQYLSRQLLGRRAGIGHAALVASGVLELGAQLLAALAASALVLGRVSPDGWANAARGWVALAAVVLLAGWPLADRLLRRWPRTAPHMAALPRLGGRATVGLLAPAIVLYGLFFLGTGAVVVMLVAAAGAPAADPWATLGAYPLAWMAGTVAVGAPAGTGVREAVLTLELGRQAGASSAALAALALRLVTLAGDLLTALVGWSVAARAKAGGR